MPTKAKNNGAYDIGGKTVKTRFKTLTIFNAFGQKNCIEFYIHFPLMEVIFRKKLNKKQKPGVFLKNEAKFCRIGTSQIITQSKSVSIFFLKTGIQDIELSRSKCSLNKKRLFLPFLKSALGHFLKQLSAFAFTNMLSVCFLVAI